MYMKTSRYWQEEEIRKLVVKIREAENEESVLTERLLVVITSLLFQSSLKLMHYEM